MYATLFLFSFIAYYFTVSKTHKTEDLVKIFLASSFPIFNVDGKKNSKADVDRASISHTAST